MGTDSYRHKPGGSAGAEQAGADGPFVSALHRAVRYIFGVLAAVCAIALFVVGVREATRADPPKPTANFVHVVVGQSHSCARTTNGIVYCWGDNQSGQSGAGEKISRDAILTSPIRIDVPGFVTMLVAGANHTCALNAEGDLYCWGKNDQGQSGTANTGPVVDEPRKVALRRPVTALAAGKDHTCAVTEDGTMSCWGSNRNGQIKPASVKDAQSSYSKPEIIDLPHKAAGVSLTANETCGLAQSGDVFCWSDAVDYAQYRQAGQADQADTDQEGAGQSDADREGAGQSDTDRAGEDGASPDSKGGPAGGRSDSPSPSQSASPGARPSASASQPSAKPGDNPTKPGDRPTKPSDRPTGSGPATAGRSMHQVPFSADFSKKAAAISNGPYGSASPWHCAFFAASREVSCWSSPSDQAGSGPFQIQKLDLKLKAPVADFAGVNGYRLDGGKVVELTPGPDGETSAGSVKLPGKAKSISSGYGSGHACAVMASGKTYCWGDNSRGQLGSSNTKEELEADELTPVLVGS